MSVLCLILGFLGCGRTSPVLLELHCGGGSLDVVGCRWFVLLSSLGSLDQGGNNTVAVAPGFGEVRAVEINKRLAEAAEDGFAACLCVDMAHGANARPWGMLN